LSGLFVWFVCLVCLSGLFVWFVCLVCLSGLSGWFVWFVWFGLSGLSGWFVWLVCLVGWFVWFGLSGLSGWFVWLVCLVGLSGWFVWFVLSGLSCLSCPVPSRPVRPSVCLFVKLSRQTSLTKDFAAILKTSGAILGTRSAYSPTNHKILALAIGT
jgi:hypothetical protein